MKDLTPMRPYGCALTYQWDRTLAILTNDYYKDLYAGALITVEQYKKYFFSDIANYVAAISMDSSDQSLSGTREQTNGLT